MKYGCVFSECGGLCPVLLPDQEEGELYVQADAAQAKREEETTTSETGEGRVALVLPFYPF